MKYKNSGPVKHETKSGTRQSENTWATYLETTYNCKKKLYQALHIYLGKQTLRPALCAR